MSEEGFSIDELAIGTATALSIVFRMMEGANITDREELVRILEAAKVGIEPYGRLIERVLEGLSAGEPPRLTVIDGDRKD